MARLAWPCAACASDDRLAFHALQEDPKAWYVPKGVFLIPPEEELPGTPIDNLKDGVTNFFSSLTGGSKEKTEKKKEESKATAKGF